MTTQIKQVHPGLSRLVICLIIKSVLDALIIGGFALAFYYSAFNPSLHGGLGEAGAEWIEGWVVDFANPECKVEVQLYIDGKFAESRTADFPHPNLVTLGLTKDERHGFLLYTPPLDPGRHEARVYAAYESKDGERRTLNLIGKPLFFQVDDYPAEPYFRGWLDSANTADISGWAIGKERPNEVVEVRLYIDGHFVETRKAEYSRPDLISAGLAADEKHGFHFFTPLLVPGEHEARVYAVRTEGGTQDDRSLRIIGRPIRFIISPTLPVSGAKEEVNPGRK